MDKNLKGLLICTMLLLIVVPIWCYMMFSDHQSDEIKSVESDNVVAPPPNIRIEKDGKLIDTIYIYKGTTIYL